MASLGYRVGNSAFYGAWKSGMIAGCEETDACGTHTDSSVSGQVVSVLKGDSIEVLHHQQAERIRLNGIDCPEKGQAYGKHAKHAASAIAFRKEVTIQTHGKDKYTRIIGGVILEDGTNVNHTLVKDGWCWWYRKYAPEDTALKGLEREARDGRQGLWADPQPVPPWEWRMGSR